MTSSSSQLQLTTYAVTSGRSPWWSARCLALCLLLCGSSAEADITQAEVETAIRNVLRNPPGAIAYPYVSGNVTLGMWLERATGVSRTATPATNLVQYLEGILHATRTNDLTAIESGVSDSSAYLHDLWVVLSGMDSSISSANSDQLDALRTIRAYVSGGYSDEHGTLVTHGIQSMLEDEARYSAGYRTATSGGDWALSVRDADAIVQLERIARAVESTPSSPYDSLTNMLGAMEYRVDDSQLRDLITQYWGDEQTEGRVEAADQSRQAGYALDDLESVQANAETEAREGYTEAESELAGMWSEEDIAETYMSESDIPSIPGGGADSGPSLPLHDFRAQGGVITVSHDILYPEGVSGSGRVWLPGVAWSPAAWGDGTGSANWMLQTFGDIVDYIWGVAFGLWVFVVARGEWRYYMTGGGSDADIMASKLASDELAYHNGMPWLMGD